MCRPLKDIVTELEAMYNGYELLYDIEERRRVIANFDHDVTYLFERLEKFQEDVKFVLDHKLNVRIISRMTLNLTHIMQHLCESVSDYFYVTELYLMDECYEKNYDLWARFIDYRKDIQKLASNLQENNIFEVEPPNEADVIIRMSYDDDTYNSGDKVTQTGMLLHRMDEVEKMNGAELFICLDTLMDVFETNLEEIKIASHKRHDETMIGIYNRNYLLYAKSYWPSQAERFRAHTTRQRLKNRVDINGLERLRQEAIYEFEYNTPTGRIWRDYSEDLVQLGVQMKEQKLDEEQWKYFFQRIFELDEYDRWIEELRNPPESEEDKQKRERLLKTNKVFCLQPAKSKYDVDILLLYVFIRDRFITEKMFVYEWFALFYILRKVGVLTNCTTEDFVKQMNDEEWFADVEKKCSANEINTYGFLTDKSPDIWDVKFKPTGNRASKNSIDNIYRKYSDLEDTIDEIYAKE